MGWFLLFLGLFLLFHYRSFKKEQMKTINKINDEWNVYYKNDK
jgi:hypothetical protein